MIKRIHSNSTGNNFTLDIEALCANFGNVLPPFVAELQRGLAISSIFAELYESNSLKLDQVNVMAVWAANVAPAMESLSTTLARNNDRLAAAL